MAAPTAIRFAAGILVAIAAPVVIMHAVCCWAARSRGMRSRWPLVMVAMALAVAGCDTAARDEDRPAAKDQPSSIKSYDAADLPKVADPLPTFLDEGRVEVSPPEGWRVLQRDRKYLARFVKNRGDN